MTVVVEEQRHRADLGSTAGTTGFGGVADNVDAAIRAGQGSEVGRHKRGHSVDNAGVVPNRP